MVEVNRMTTPKNMRWKLLDRQTGAEGAAIDWRFRVGERVKVRMINEMDSDHPMHHPFHIHGVLETADGSAEKRPTALTCTRRDVDLHRNAALAVFAGEVRENRVMRRLGARVAGSHPPRTR